MIPYGDFTFFLIALIALLPVIILGFLGKRSYIYNGVVTAFMIVLIFLLINIICLTKSI